MEIAYGIIAGVALLCFIAYIIFLFIQASKGKKYLTKHFEEVITLSKHYASIAIAFIEKLKAIDPLLLTASYDATRNSIISYYWQQKPHLLLSEIYQYDGFKRPKNKVNLILSSEKNGKELTEQTISELKSKIISDKAWLDRYTIPCLIYFIIRNNIIEIIGNKLNSIIPKGRENYDNERTKICKTVGKTIDIDEEVYDDNALEKSETVVTETMTEQEQRNAEAMRQMQKEAKQLKAEQEQKQREWFWEQQRKEREEQEQREREKRQREQKSIEYFNEHKFDLSNKYSTIVFNFIEKLTEKYPHIFLRMFNNMETLQSSILVKPYENASQLLKTKILNDGLEFTESDNSEANKKIQELTNFFIQGLKKRIVESGDYNDEFTFSALLYCIVRDNVIKYYRNEYIETYGYESLDELCDHIANPFEQDKTNIKILDDVLTISRFMSNNAISQFVYYYIYENNIELSFVDTYKKIILDMKQIFERKKKEKFENDLFGKPKKKTISENDTPHTLSAIDRIDRMSGEQFEIFMEDYFRKQGFKVERTPLSGDYGIDLIIENDFSKIGVQAKCYSNKVTASAVQEVVTGLRHYGLSGGMVVTNNYFQPAAIQLAKDNGITLWNRDKLIEKLN